MIRQKTKYDCGPVAIINFMRWAGQPWGEDDIPLLRYALLTDRRGSPMETFANFVDTLNPGRALYLGDDGSDALNLLYSQGCCFVGFSLEPNSAHVIFAYMTPSGRIILTNFVKGKKKTVVSVDQFIRIFLVSHTPPITIEAA